MSNATPGNPLKYGETTTLRLSIPEAWDLANLTEIAVSVTNESGSVVDSGTATLWAASALDEATLAHATSIILATGAEDLVPGDMLRIGNADEIAREIREVYAYDKTTRTATLTRELEYAHIDTADVLPMWATYDFDLETVADFPKGMELTVAWIPDTADGEYTQVFEIGVTEFAATSLWTEFETIYPTEWARIQNRDLVEFERIARRAMKREMIDPRGGARNLDKIVDMDLMQEGLLLRCRLLAMAGTGDQDQLEYGYAKADWDAWIASINSLSIWEDTDQDKVIDETETPVPMFCEIARY
jgi:hypothetical protein